MRVLILLLCLVAMPAWAQSENDAEVVRLQAQLRGIEQEQQSVYQQFQMLQTFRHDEQLAAHPPVIENPPVYNNNMDTPPPNYDDIVKEKAAREQRIQQYTADLNNLYARHQLLEQQKQALLARLRQLTQP
jgi:type II secretory pathway pseudopilin PulG